MIMKTTGSEMSDDFVGFGKDQDGLSCRADE